MSEPRWRSYLKDPLRHGWSYPIGRDHIERLLLDVCVRVDLLSLDMPPADHRPLQLVRVRRYGDLSAQGKRMLSEGAVGIDPVAFSVYGIPRDQLEVARATFSNDGVLEGAIEWIASARTRGNAWQATERIWRAHLDGTSTVTREEQRQARGPLLGSIGIDD